MTILMVLLVIFSISTITCVVRWRRKTTGKIIKVHGNLSTTADKISSIQTPTIAHLQI